MGEKPVAVPSPAVDPAQAREDKLVRATQWALASTAPVVIGGIVYWIIHLIRTSLFWGDVTSASVGISLVAIPVFLTLLGIFLYVFVGLLRDGGAR